jgi:hypothetical protein
VPGNNFTISTLTTNQSTTDPGPYLVPPQFNFAGPPYAPITLNIPTVAGANAGAANTGVSPANANTDFTLAWTGTGTSAVAQITVATTNLFTPANAGLFFASFNYFQQQLAALPAGTLAPNGIAVLANRIVTCLPLNYTQILPLTYGLVPNSRYVDLAPGMNLVVDYSSFLYLSAPSVSIGALNAFSGAGSVRFRLRRRADGTIGFNAFTDMLRSWTIKFNTPNQVAGLSDLEAAGATANFVRLVYPAQMQNTNQITVTQPSANLNPVLLFASSLANMEQATKNFLQSSSPGAAGQMVFFSGRAAIYPEIVVSLNGSPTPVPLGTTLADLVNTMLVMSPFDTWNSSFGAGPTVQMARWAQNTTISTPGSYQLFAFTFNSTTSVSSSTGLTQWDIPLVAGDDVRWVVSLS